MEHTQRALHNKHGKKLQPTSTASYRLTTQAILFALRLMRLPAPIWKP